MNQSEWKDKLLSTLSAYREVILSNSSNWSLPKYRIAAKTFFPNYDRMLLNNLKSLNSNTFMDKIDYSEYRLVSLISCLNSAKEKYQKHLLGESQYPQSNSSQIIRVNNIIRSSFELTSFISVLDWLQKVYQKDRSLSYEKIRFDEMPKDIHPDLFNQPGTLNEVNRKKYEELMANVILQIRRGELWKGQETAEYRNQFFLSSILEGGLPLHDFSIDSAELFSQIDFDLFPPYMKNREFLELKNAVSNRTQLAEVYGNQNWTLWLSSLYETSELCNSDASFQLNRMSSYLTGSAPLNKSYLEPIDDLLYRNVLLLLNSTLLEHYSKDKDAIDYYYTAEGNEAKLIEARNGRTVFDVLSFIRKSEQFKELMAIDYSLELELDLIELHFKANEAKGHMDYYQLLYLFLEKINDFCIKSDKLTQVLMNNYKQISQLQSSNMLLDTNASRRQSNVFLMKVNYFKMLFVMLISFIGVNGELIDNCSESNREAINAIYVLYDDIISAYCFNLLQVTTDPLLLVYIPSFMFHLIKSQEILAKLANLLSDSQDAYQLLVNEIERHFSSNREEMSTFLANKTSILSFDSSLKTIDTVLEERVRDRLNQRGAFIAEEDINKINQLKMLLTEGKINKEILIKYILLLAFNFLAVNKFTEVFLMINETFAFYFNAELANKPIEEFLQELKTFYSQANYHILIQEMAIRSSIRLIYQVVNCFMLYGDVVYETRKEFSASSSSLFNKAPTEEDVTSSLDALNQLMRLIVTNRTMTAFISEFLGESAYEDIFKKLINDWVYQSIKWACDLKTNDVFLQKRIVTEIDNPLYFLHNLAMFSDIMMIHYHILKKPFGADDGLNMLNREELFYQFISPDNKQAIIKLLYASTTKNAVYLKEVFDTQSSDALLKDIDRLDF